MSLHYSIIDLDNGAITDLQIDDPPWFSQVVNTSEDHMLLQVYEDSQNPDNVTLRCYHLENGSLVWQIPAARFIRMHTDHYVVRTPEQAEICLERNTGNVMTAPAGKHIESSEATMIIPVHYPEGESYFDDVASFIRSDLGNEAVRAIDYAEVSGYIFISYYKKSADGKLALDLVVLDEQGEACLFEPLGKELSGIADPPFMFYNGNLIFVKEKRHFFVYALPTDY
ncbi:MAG: hypothetical protein P8X57_07065 [Cyclobacteriaceae bacterium]